MAREMPDADKIEFKPKFLEHYAQLTDIDEFKKYCLMFLRRSIRVNTLKISVPALKKRLTDWILTPVPWCKEGFWIEHKEKRRDVGNLLEHALGYIYIQEAASMIPPIVLDPQPGELVLDMCASPGSKASQIAQYMKNNGILVANDFKGDRLAPLGMNLQRCGITNTVVTLMHGEWFANYHAQFDRILVDAPCSGTGTIRKSIRTLRIWNPNMCRKLSFTQKKLLETAYHKLKPGGTLVYSTCSLEPVENEGVVSWFLDKYPDAALEKIKLNICSSPPVQSFGKETYHKDIAKTLRLWPQDNDTEGFFVAKIKKH